MLRNIAFVLMVLLLVAIVIYKPYTTSEPGANPKDPAREDLTRIQYPSLATIPWEPRFIKPQDTIEKMFGKEWVYVARFNRIDRRHLYPGMTIRVPKDMAQIRAYTPNAGIL